MIVENKPMDAYAVCDNYRGWAKIHVIVWIAPHSIVFLDEDYFVWYDWDACDESPAGFEYIRNRVGILEAIDVSHLSESQVISFKRLLGDAIVCIIQENNRSEEHTSELQSR